MLAGAYQSEYDFQLDIAAVLLLSRDGHLDFIGDALGIFEFQRDFSLVSVSSDGMELPEVFYTGLSHHRPPQCHTQPTLSGPLIRLQLHNPMLVIDFHDTDFVQATFS